MLTHVKKLTNPKNFDSRKNIFDPRNSRKNYDPRNMLIHVKNILIHVTHVTTQLTQFNWHISYKFQKFSESWDLIHKTSSLEFSQSNTFVEWYIHLRFTDEKNVASTNTFSQLFNLIDHNWCLIFTQPLIDHEKAWN